MARRRGLVAPTSARRCEFQRSWLQKMDCTTCAAFQHACGCVRDDAGMLEAGWAADEYAFGLACAAHQRRHVVARRGRGGTGWRHARLIGQEAMVPSHGGPSRADLGVGAFARRARCLGGGVWVGRRRAWPSRVTGRRVALSGGPYWFLAPNGSLAQDDKYNGAMADELTRQATWAGMPPVAQRALRATRAAPRTCLFW